MTRLERAAIAKMLEEAASFINPYGGRDVAGVQATTAYREGHTAAYTGIRDRLTWIMGAKAEQLKGYINR